MNPRHFRILDLALDGLSIHQIATEVSLTDLHVRKIFGAPNFQHELAMRRARRTEMQDQSSVDKHDETVSRLQQESLAAAEHIIDTMMDDDEDSKLRVACAKDILDRDGYQPKPTTVAQQAGITLIINDADGARLTESLILDTDSKVVDCETLDKPADSVVDHPDPDSQLDENQSGKSSVGVAVG